MDHNFDNYPCEVLYKHSGKINELDRQDDGEHEEAPLLRVVEEALLLSALGPLWVYLGVWDVELGTV